MTPIQKHKRLNFKQNCMDKRSVILRAAVMINCPQASPQKIRGRIRPRFYGPIPTRVTSAKFPNPNKMPEISLPGHYRNIFLALNLVKFKRGGIWVCKL